MACVTVKSATCFGLAAYPIRVEVDITYGLPKYTLVGLPDPSIRESWSRVRSAIKNSGFKFPCDVVTVNLGPANLRKEGPAFDLPIAIGILAADELIPKHSLSNYLFVGELALDGSLRPIKGGDYHFFGSEGPLQNHHAGRKCA